MNENRHIIWSNYDLNYEDWKEFLESEYPDLSDNERLALMYEINGDYLDDERSNLNIQISDFCCFTVRERPQPSYDLRAAPGGAMTGNGDNDTPVQPQPERDKRFSVVKPSQAMGAVA